VGGRWSPSTHYFGTDRGGPRRDRPFGKTKFYEPWRWTYFGDDAAPRVLLALHVTADNLDDTLWYMGSTEAELDAPDGMVVFGFGRGKEGPLLRGAGQQFVIGLVEGHPQDALVTSIARTAGKWLSSTAARTGANGPLRIHPTNPGTCRRFKNPTVRCGGLSGRVAWWHTLQDHERRLESGADPPPVFDYDAFLATPPTATISRDCGGRSCPVDRRGHEDQANGT
jgi:hypothetical protein